MKLKEIEDGMRYEYNEQCWHSTDGQVYERKDILAFLRAEAAKGTSDWEYRLRKLADEIEHGKHEDSWTDAHEAAYQAQGD